MDFIERYMFFSDCWIVILYMCIFRVEFGCMLVGFKIYVVGGYNWDLMEWLRLVECFDFDFYIWMEMEEVFLVELIGFSLVCIKIFNGGGY